MSERRCAWGEIGIRSDAVDAFELITISISSAPHNQPHVARFLLKGIFHRLARGHPEPQSRARRGRALNRRSVLPPFAHAGAESAI
jgi:hypothetical protein